MKCLPANQKWYLGIFDNLTDFDIMHELSIADSIIRTTIKWRDSQGCGKVETVGLRLGTLSDIVPDALQFGFEALTKGTDMESTRLQIETVKVKGRCRACETEFEIDDLLFECPSCQSRDIKMTQGQEIEIVYFEFDDTNQETTSND